MLSASRGRTGAALLAILMVVGLAIGGAFQRSAPLSLPSPSDTSAVSAAERPHQELLAAGRTPAIRSESGPPAVAPVRGPRSPVAPSPRAQNLPVPPPPATGRILGIVYDVEGRPLPGAQIAFSKTYDPLTGSGFKEVADENGAYRTRELDSGLYTALFQGEPSADPVLEHAEELGSRVVGEVEVLAGQTVPFDVWPEGSATLTGRFLYAERGEPPYLGVVLRLFLLRVGDDSVAATGRAVGGPVNDKPTGFGHDEDGEKISRTPEQLAGWFRFNGLAPGEYRLRIVYAEDREGNFFYAERDVTIGAHDVDLPLEVLQLTDIDQFWLTQDFERMKRPPRRLPPEDAEPEPTDATGPEASAESDPKHDE